MWLAESAALSRAITTLVYNLDCHSMILMTLTIPVIPGCLLQLCLGHSGLGLYSTSRRFQTV